MTNGNGYIPSGGVWTAEERSAMRDGRIGGNHRVALRIADATVSALIAALESSLKDLKRAYTEDEWREDRDVHARIALLEKLRS